MISNRLLSFDSMSTGLGYLTNSEIITIFKKGAQAGGWSDNAITTFNGRKLFMKFLALPALELQNPYNTGNLYHLPLELNMHGMGINVWRELLVLLKTTNWVLSGRIHNFPLLYHYRIIKRKSKSLYRKDILEYAEKTWNHKPQVIRRTEDVFRSQYSILVCIEYIGPGIVRWLNSKKRLSLYYSQSKRILNFLREEGVLLFDNHAGNILTDSDDNIYYTDFGLVLDREFNLTLPERRFFQNHITFPYANAYSIPFFLVYEHENVLEAMRKMFDFNEDITIRDDILPHLLEFCKLMGFTSQGVSILEKYKDIVTEFGKAHESVPLKYPWKIMNRLMAQLE